MLSNYVQQSSMQLPWNPFQPEAEAHRATEVKPISQRRETEAANQKATITDNKN